MPRVFISYRREDSIAYAGRIFDRLTSQFGVSNVFMDVDALEPGVDFVEVLQGALESCDVLLAVIGRIWLTARDPAGRPRLSDPDDFVAREIAAALERPDIRVIPVLVGGARMPQSAELPDRLSGLTRRQALTIPDIGFHQTLGRLIESIERAGQERLARQKAQAAERADQERLAREKALAAERADQERMARQKALAAERADQERMARQKAQAVVADGLAKRSDGSPGSPTRHGSKPRPVRVVTIFVVAASLGIWWYTHTRPRSPVATSKATETNKGFTSPKSSQNSSESALRPPAVQSATVGVLPEKSSVSSSSETTPQYLLPPPKKGFVASSSETSSLATPEYVFDRSFDTKGVPLAVTEDGKYLAAGDSSYTIWETLTGTLVTTLEGRSNYVSSLSFSPDRRYLAAGVSSSSIRIWDLAPGRDASSKTGTITAGRALPPLTGHKSEVDSVAFSPDSRLLASGGADWTIKLWQVDAGRQWKSLSGHRGAVLSIAFGPDGRSIASGSADKTAKIWDLTTGKAVRTVVADSGDGVQSVALSPDGEYMASGGGGIHTPPYSWRDSKITVWRIGTGEAVATRAVNESAFVSALAFSSDGKDLVIGQWDGEVLLCRWSTNTAVRIDRGHGERVRFVAFAANGSYIVAGDNLYKAYIWRRRN